MKKKILMLAISFAISTAALMAHNANGESCCKDKSKAQTESCCKTKGDAQKESCCKSKANKKDCAKTKDCKNAEKCSKCPKKNASQQPATQEAPAKK